ncbi:MAG: arginine deiminase-related protein, partial [Bacteroidota bacterium]|nr:arginine deiminase-related protein [Candidatus Kapabacteria bacterium]MDW8220805.1 arginine deiminase-related protein [Bacteroidota bacterium]
FGFNPEAARTNSFMEDDSTLSSSERDTIHTRAHAEFTGFVEALRRAGITVVVIEDTPEPHKPDALFPNNWISFHDDGRIVLYPMEPPNRRLERREDIVTELSSRFGFTRIEDLSHFELQGIFLEGTGSLVLDRAHKLVYANRSSRMHTVALHEFTRRMGYTAIEFTARRSNGGEIYHTNVMMSVGDGIAVLCTEVIRDSQEREAVLASLRCHHAILEITEKQMDNFAGNILHVHNHNKERYWVMSSRAFHALDDAQKRLLERDSTILHIPLDTIERYGGGSARCMLAEIFTPPTSP